MRRALVLSTVAALAILTGCSNAASEETPPTAEAPAADPLAQFPPSERAFIQAYTRKGYSNSGGNAAIARTGQLICSEIRQGVPPAETQEILASGGLSATQAAEVYELANRNICVDAEPIFVPTSVAPPPPPPGPLTSFGDGTWEVGVDVEPGKYKTSGSDLCYWGRLRANDGSLNDIIDNHAGAGPQTVTINDGEYFETQGCGSWTRQS